MTDFLYNLRLKEKFFFGFFEKLNNKLIYDIIFDGYLTQFFKFPSIIKFCKNKRRKATTTTTAKKCFSLWKYY